MPHNISTQLKQHLESECTTTAILWKIVRVDGEVYTFTNHVENIVYNKLVYFSDTGVDLSSIASKSDYSVDNLDLVGFLKQTGVNEEDLLADLFDDAIVEVLMVDYNNLDYGHLTLKNGFIGQLNQELQVFTAEVRGLTQKLEQNFGQLTSPTCRARFCDARCKLNFNSSIKINNLYYDLQTTGTVNNIINNRLIIDNSRTEPTSFFNYGYLVFTSGLNNTRKMEIRNFTNNQILLFLPMPKEIKPNDTYTLYAGCDKTFSTCINRYNNAINFRGEPHLPGRDRIYESCSTRTKGSNRYNSNEF